MGYATLAMVKELLGFDVTDATNEPELKRCIANADGRIDSIFAQVNAVVPSTVPQQVKDGSAQIAAYYFYRNRNPTNATVFLKNGVEEIMQYIQGKYYKGVAYRYGHEHFETTS